VNYKKIYYPVKGLAVLSLVAVAIKYWMPTEIGFAFMLLPYLLLYFCNYSASSEMNISGS
jgi:hypothetical protein